MKGLSRWSSGVLVAAAMAFVAPRARAGDLTLEVSGECPGQLTLRWSGAEPNRPMAIGYGERLGTTRVLGYCQGTELGITWRIRLVAIIRTGSSGSGSVAGQVSNTECGGYLQLMVGNSSGSPCQTSNVVQIPE